MSCFPFRNCIECLQGPSFSATQSYAHLRDEVQCIKLDTQFMGSDVVLLKNGTRICGTGAALATAPIVQSKAYFQINVQQSGVWGVGLASRKVNLNKIPVLEHAWIMCNNGCVMANGIEIDRLPNQIEEGDSIGVAFDHVELKFYKNNELLPVSITNIREQVFPIVYVDESAIIDAKFSSFTMVPPAGYQEIMIEQTLL